MSYWPEVGGAWGCRVNSHKAGWNSTICTDPCNWDCGAQAGFRERYCADGDRSCFQIDAFAPVNPSFVVHEKGLKWLIDEDRDALNDQVLFVYTHEHREPGGVLHNGKFVVGGLYVVDHVEVIEQYHQLRYRVFPKESLAVGLVDLLVPTQRYSSLGRPYMMHFDSTAVQRMRDQLVEAAERRDAKDRRVRMLRSLDRHLEQAARTNDQRREREGLKYVEHSGTFQSPFAKLKNFPVAAPPAPSPAPSPPARANVPAAPPANAAPPPSTVAAPKAAEPELPGEAPLAPLFDLSTLRHLGKTYGEDVTRALWLSGRRANAMILLRGAPGIGKSRLALEITPRDRRLVVPVPSTWRGREDVLGYVSPIGGDFQPAPLTEFLRRAAKAWDEGDREPFVVLFEEFNLSPPEFWFSDILVLSQYDADAVDGRTIQLGGRAPKSWGTEGAASVWLSPAVRFIGTINSDHTTRDLSPRVLDRVSLIQVEMTPDKMIASLDLEIEHDQLQAIKDLHHRLESRGAVFSMRTARALENAFEAMETIEQEHPQYVEPLLLGQVGFQQKANHAHNAGHRRPDFMAHIRKKA